MAGNRIELSGRLVRAAQLRVTPSGTPVLRMAVGCGAAGDDLTLNVTIAGERARELAAVLKPAMELKATGILRSLRKGAAHPIIEVMADSVELTAGRTQ